MQLTVILRFPSLQTDKISHTVTGKTEKLSNLLGFNLLIIRNKVTGLSVLSPCTSWRGHFFYGIKSIEPFALPVDPRTEKILPEVLELELA